MSRTQPLRHRLFLTQGLVVLLLAVGVLGAALWGARRAVQALSRELVDRAALEVETHLEGLYEPAAEHLDSLAELGPPRPRAARRATARTCAGSRCPGSTPVPASGPSDCSPTMATESPCAAVPLDGRH